MRFAATSIEPDLGTRFAIFPQAPYVPGYASPEVVWISTSPHEIQPGPADSRMYVRDPLLTKEPYQFPYLPPYVGETFPPAVAATDGHFDAIGYESRQFLSAHVFACARRVLDIWESYLRGPIVWHFSDTYERLELIPYLEWNNAQAGFGFIEFGSDERADGRRYPHALNFDVIAHEIGHIILFSIIGAPESIEGQEDFGAIHESFSDLISLLGFLHFDTGLDRLLRRTKGNLYSLNELNRIGELADERQIRVAGNDRKMSNVSFELHDRSRPMTGAIFDTVVELYHQALVERDLADERLLQTNIRNFDDVFLGKLSELTARSYSESAFLFKSALTEARDVVGLTLASCWNRLDPMNISFESAAEILVDEAALINSTAGRVFERNFEWRQIL